MKVVAGDTVKVPKGVHVQSTRPAGHFTTKRSQVVKIDHLISWPADDPLVTWAGANGYWNRVRASQVLPI